MRVDERSEIIYEDIARVTEGTKVYAEGGGVKVTEK
jgi:hypothetical protein